MDEPKPAPVGPGVTVFFGGLTTSLLTLAGVWWLSRVGWDPMGLYANYVIPVGAILVGIIAGLGYTLAAMWKNCRIGKGLVAAILLLQLVIYFAAQYITYRVEMGPAAQIVSFSHYYQMVVESRGWEEKGAAAQPFGKWGWGIEALSIAGFMLGSLLPMATLTGKPYCDYCNIYMKKGTKRLLYADVETRKISRKDAEAQAAYESERQAASEAALGELSQVVSLIGERRYDEALARVDSLPELKDSAKVPRKLSIEVHRCPMCDNFHLQASQTEVNGSNVTTNKVFEFQKKV